MRKRGAMRSVFFVLLCSVLFFAVGPLVPLLAHGSLSPGALVLSPFAYFFGGIYAAGLGVVFALISLLSVRFSPRLIPRGGRIALALAGALLGLGVGALLFFVPALWWALDNPALAQANNNTVGYWLQTDAPGYLFRTFVLPTAVCGAIAWSWLLPQLLQESRVNAADGGQRQS